MAYRKIASPTPDPESMPFWEAAKRGEFLVKKCQECGKVHWYPRAICPMCGSAKTEWVKGSGKGTVYTFTPMRKAKEPYIVAYVTLDEGPTMLTNIVDCGMDDVKIGQKVELVFVPTANEGAPPVPCFKPV
jgi:uncharacterized OB-fold protein